MEKARLNHFTQVKPYYPDKSVLHQMFYLRCLQTRIQIVLLRGVLEGSSEV